MNASDDEVFEDTIGSLEAKETSETLEVKVHTTPKSATRSMTTYKTLCTNRMKAVNDAVKECRETDFDFFKLDNINKCPLSS